MTGQRDELSQQVEDEPADKVTRFVHRLTDMVVEEVSPVDRPANRRRYLVVKKEGDDDMGGLGQEVFEKDDGTMTTDPLGCAAAVAEATGATAAAEAADSGDNSDAEVEGSEKAISIPKPVKAKVLSMLEGASNRLASLIADTKAAKETDEKLAQPVPSALGSEVGWIASVLRGVLSKYPHSAAKATGEMDEEEEDERDGSKSGEKQAVSLPKPVKDAMMKVLEEVRNRLASVVANIKAAAETDEQITAPLPDEIGGEIMKLADLMDGLLKKYPYPAPAAKADSGLQTAADEALKLLQVAVGKMQAGKTLDEESMTAVKKARELLAAARSSKAKTGEEEDGEEDREKTQKAGAKMARARRMRFKQALDELMKLFDEILPMAERAAQWPRKQTSTMKSEEVEETKELEELREKLEKTEEKLRKANRERNEAERQPARSNVENVEKKGQQTKRFSWGFDLNESDDE